MKITPEATISSLVIPAAQPQRSLAFGALKFTKLPCPFVFLAKALLERQLNLNLVSSLDYICISTSDGIAV